MKQETILLIDTVTDSMGNTIYRVLTNKDSYAFLDIEAAKEYAGRVLTNGKAQKTNRPLSRQWVGGIEPAKKKIEFILDSCAKTGMTVKDVTNLAKQHADAYIASVPYGTWSGIISVLTRKKKLSAIGRREKACVYRTTGR